MNSHFFRLLCISVPTAILATAFTAPAVANPGSTQEAQATSVSQLSDVRSTDWAFTALQSLVERYGCIAGYPNRTFRGQRAMTRFEFAAGLNACLDKVNEIIAAGLADKVSADDFATLQKLQEQFGAELAALRGRVDALEARTTRLEAQQFSTTTKLVGEAIFAVSGVARVVDDQRKDFAATGFAGAPVGLGRNVVFQNRVRLDFLTSFTGSDRLRTRLQMGNAQPLLSSGTVAGANALASNNGRLNFDDSTLATNNNSVNLEVLDYSFPLGSQGRVTIFANGGNHFYYADTVNPALDNGGGGNGAISRFGERNPIYNINGGGAGLGLTYRFGEALRLDLGYLANTGSNPSIGTGLFGGNYSALGQVVVNPTPQIKLGLTYVLGYNNTTAGQSGFRFGSPGQATGTFQSNLIAGSAPSLTPGPVSTNSYGAQVSFQFSPNVILGGWAGYTTARIFNLGDAETWNYAMTLAFPNLFKEGNLLGLVVGTEPSLRGLRDYEGNALSTLGNTETWHLEAFYRYRLNNNISITPGVIVILNPNQTENPGLVVGTLRTTFSF
jgi:hypothetical protein